MVALGEITRTGEYAIVATFNVLCRHWPGGKGGLLAYGLPRFAQRPPL
jgi:hypothetical protein